MGIEDASQIWVCSVIHERGGEGSSSFPESHLREISRTATSLRISSASSPAKSFLTFGLNRFGSAQSHRNTQVSRRYLKAPTPQALHPSAARRRSCASERRSWSESRPSGVRWG